MTVERVYFYAVHTLDNHHLWLDSIAYTTSEAAVNAATNLLEGSEEPDLPIFMTKDLNEIAIMTPEKIPKKWIEIHDMRVRESFQ